MPDAREHAWHPTSIGVRDVVDSTQTDMSSKNIRPQPRRSRAAASLAYISICVLAPSTVAAQSTVSSHPGTAQERAEAEGADQLGELLRLASSVNPSIVAAQSRVAAARARVGPAAAWPDPMLMAGVQNLPLTRMSGNGSSSMGGSPPGDDMTMKMLGVEQTIPFPGKPGLRRRIAEREVDAALANLETVSLAVATDVKRQYFELAYIERALEIVNRKQALIGDVSRVAEARYAAGTGRQEDVLKTRVEAARLGETASELLEQRRAVLAELNSLVERESASPVASTEIPARMRDAAVNRDPAQISFVAQTLGSRAANSPLPSLEALQTQAVRSNPALRERGAMIAAQAARVELARKASRPDVDLSLQYGQRDQRPDMISAVVSVPLPLHKRSRQDQELAEARAGLAAMEADARAMANKVKSDVARAVSDLERTRTQLALYTRAILPQGQAAVTSSMASYQSGSGDLLSALGNQATLLEYEIAYHRALADFARSVADLEQLVGEQVLP